MSDEHRPASPLSAYSDLTREELEARLVLAEDVCVLYGWTGGGPETDRDKALYMLWSEWVRATGGGDRQSHPHLTDEHIARLAAERDAIRERTLGRIRSLPTPTHPHGPTS